MSKQIIPQITGARISAILGTNPYLTTDDVIRAMVREYHGSPTESTDNIATSHSANTKRSAQLAFTRKTGRMVETCAYVKYNDFIGAKPDGMIDGALVKFRSPFSLRNEAKAEFKPIQEQPHYYDLVQFEMAVTGYDECYFVQYVPPKGTALDIDYVPEQINIEPVTKDDGWINARLPAINTFYKLYESELKNKAHLEPLRVEINTPEAQTMVDYIDELDATIQAATDAKKVEIEKLIELANNKDAIICGRKLTKVTRKGGVQYAKLLKELGVDANKVEEFRGKESVSWRFS